MFTQEENRLNYIQNERDSLPSVQPSLRLEKHTNDIGQPTFVQIAKLS